MRSETFHISCENVDSGTLGTFIKLKLVAYVNRDTSEKYTFYYSYVTISRGNAQGGIVTGGK